MSDGFITMLVFGEPKKGKTWFGASAPRPILVMDAEAGGFRHVPGRHIEWNVMAGEDVPEWNDDWDICKVKLDNDVTLDTVKQILKSGKHPFKSVVIDSISRFQDQMKRNFGVGADLEQKHWGKMLMKIEDVATELCAAIERQPEWEAFVVISAARVVHDKYRPYLAGQIADKIGYLFDCEAFLFTAHDDEGDLRRGLRIVGDNKVEAGNRGMESFGEIIWDPDLTRIIKQLKEEYEQ
jgi:hypothetical protein